MIMLRKQMCCSFGLLFMMLLLLSGCGPKSTKVVSIADQFGLAYAPIEIIKSKGFFDEALAEVGLGSTEVVWKRMGNTSAIREAMVAGDLDIGFVAIPPFLIGKDNGMDWRIMSGISESPVGLVTSEQGVESIADLAKTHRIILPQPGSIQHILLAMQAEKELGDARYFDRQLMAMSHPDGTLAMQLGDTKNLHFTTPPFLQQELAQEKNRVILDGETAFGEPFTFVVAICPLDFYEDEKVYRAFMKALTEAIDFMEEQPLESFEILRHAYDYEPELLAEVLEDPQMRFNKNVSGLEAFQTFMLNQGMIRNTYDVESLIWGSYEE